jgi:hypothetical protein
MRHLRLWIVPLLASASFVGALVALAYLGVPVVTPLCEVLLFPGYLVASVIGATAHERLTAFLVATLTTDCLLYASLFSWLLRRVLPQTEDPPPV